MPKLYVLPMALLSCCAMLLFLQCKENIEPDNSDKNFPVNLRISQDGETVKFEWDNANTSTFNSYVLVRSTTEIETGRAPLSSQTIYTQDSQDSTGFVDENLPLADKLYYKLYVKLDGRFVESATQKVTLDNFLVEGRPNSVIYVPGSNLVVVANAGATLGSLEVIDLQSKSIVASKNNVVVSQAEYTGIDVGKDASGNPELYYWPSNASFSVLSLPDLTVKKSSISQVTAFGLASNQNGFFFTTQYDYDNAFATRRASDFSIVKGYYRSSYYEHRLLKVLDYANNRVMEAAPYLLTAFNVNTASGTTSNIKSLNTNYYYVLPQEIVLSPDRKHAIPQRDGKIYNTETLAEVDQVPQANGTNSLFVDFAFSDDGKFVYSLNQSAFFFNTTVIEKFSFPEMKLITSKSIENVSPHRLLSTPAGMYLVGFSVNNLNQYTIKRLSF